MVLTDNWNHWQASVPVEVMRPHEPYEGANYPITHSKAGVAIHVHQLRDPYLFEENGKYYLFYCVAGETGIAMAEIQFHFKEETLAEEESLIH